MEEERDHAYYERGRLLAELSLQEWKLEQIREHVQSLIDNRDMSDEDRQMHLGTIREHSK